MNQSFNGDFSGEVAEEFLRVMKTPEEQARYTIEVDKEFTEGVPIVLATRYMNKMTSGIIDDYELEDLIMHHAVKGKSIKILLDGVQVGGLVINNLADSWDAFPVFNQHPLAFNVMKEAITWSVVKKLMPPLKKGTGAQAAAPK